VLAKVSVALEEPAISVEDLQALSDLGAPTSREVDPKKEDIILLNNGYWLRRKDVAAEGLCTCDRQTCVDSMSKVYCYFSTALSIWVVRTGLFWKCYDEFISCTRCSNIH
jgi:hypothetical protein